MSIHTSTHACMPDLHKEMHRLTPPRTLLQTKRILVPTRTNATINRLEKTRTVRSADELPAAKEEYLAGVRAERRREAEVRKKEEERVARERREEREGREKGWEELMQGQGRSNEEGFDEDNFM